jgi:hypothetical protein
MNKLKITIIAIMVALTAFLFLLPNQPDAVWLKWLSIALWIVLIIIIARNSDLFERVKLEDKEPKSIKIDPDLEEFLIRKGAYEKFLININSDANFYPEIKYACSIRMSFRFDLTPEGEDYWHILDDEYNEEFESRLWE